MKKIYLLFSLILSLAIFNFGQGTERTIDFPPIQPENSTNKIENGKYVPTDIKAVELVSISVEGKPITLGKPFTAGDDWLKTLTVKLKNVSDKNIASVNIAFGQPEAKLEDSTIGFTLFVGTLNAVFDKTIVDKSIKPGEEFELAQTEKQFLANKNLNLKKLGVYNINRLVIGITTVKFEDREMWSTRKIPSVK